MEKSRFQRARRALIFWTLFIGIGAVGGAAMMLIDPSGRAMGMDAMLPYLTTLLALMFTGKKLRAPAADGVPFVHPISMKRAEKNSKTTHTKKRSA